eukprot:1400286-Amphidinium_carterae.1
MPATSTAALIGITLVDTKLETTTCFRALRKACAGLASFVEASTGEAICDLCDSFARQAHLCSCGSASSCLSPAGLRALSAHTAPWSSASLVRVGMRFLRHVDVENMMSTPFRRHFHVMFQE